LMRPTYDPAGDAPPAVNSWGTARLSKFFAHDSRCAADVVEWPNCWQLRAVGGNSDVDALISPNRTVRVFVVGYATTHGWITIDALADIAARLARPSKNTPIQSALAIGLPLAPWSRPTVNPITWGRDDSQSWTLPNFGAADPYADPYSLPTLGIAPNGLWRAHLPNGKTLAVGLDLDSAARWVNVLRCVGESAGGTMGLRTDAYKPADGIGEFILD
jgi:hypothetical protein